MTAQMSPLRWTDEAQSEPAAARLEPGSLALDGLPSGATKSPRRSSVSERRAGSAEDILAAAIDASLGSDAEGTEEEEISGYIDPAMLNRVLMANMPKLCSVYVPQGK